MRRPNEPICFIPWYSPEEWKEANAVISSLIGRYGSQMDPVRSLAEDLKIRLEMIFPVLNKLCRVSCPWCPDPCCARATVWFDFADLVFIHLMELPVPHCQPYRREDGSSCCHMGVHGCRLSRTTRPWSCTAYLCPTQANVLRKNEQRLHHRLNQSIKAIKTMRKKMEDAFIERIT